MDRSATSVFFSVLTVLLIGFVMKVAQPVIITLLIAAFLAYIMDPLVSWLKRIGVPLWAAVLVSVVLYLAAFLVFGFVFYQSSTDFARTFPRYQEAFFTMLRHLVDRLQPSIGKVLQVNLVDELRKIRVAPIVLSAAGRLANLITRFVVIYLFSTLILLGKYGFTRKLLRSFPRKEAKRIAMVLVHIDRGLRRYIGIKSFVSMLVGVGSGVALAVFGVEFAIIFGFLTFILNFVPYLGSTIAVALPGLIALVQFGSLGRALWVVFALVVIQNAVAYVLEPRIVGQRLNLSIAIIFFSLLFWGWLWGAAGVLLAIPMTTSIKVVMQNIPSYRPFALLLERPSARRQTPPG